MDEYASFRANDLILSISLDSSVFRHENTKLFF
jgi:hypothetical protein